MWKTYFFFVNLTKLLEIKILLKTSLYLTYNLSTSRTELILHTVILKVSILQLWIRGLPFIFRYYRTKTNINHLKSFYCFSKYSPLRSIHSCMRLNQLSKHFCHSDWLIFWAIDKLCGIQREQIFLIVKCTCNIECMLVPLMLVNLTIGHMTILQYQLAHSINSFRNNN